MSLDLKDYPSIDIMNHLLEIRRDLAGNPFVYKEFQIMLQTTFRKLTKPPKETAAGSETKKAKTGSSSGAMLTGHASPAECVMHMDELGYTHVAVCATKMWSYHYHHDFIMNYPIEPIGEAVKETGGRIIGAASYSPFHIGKAPRSNAVLQVRLVSPTLVRPSAQRPAFLSAVPEVRGARHRRGLPGRALGGGTALRLRASDARRRRGDRFPGPAHQPVPHGWPWVDEWCSMLWRHPNVYGDISAYYAKSLDERLVRFMDSGRGRHKVLFGTNGVGLERCKREFLELDISEETKRAVLHDNVVRFLGLEAD
jgi:hypothetical protein